MVASLSAPELFAKVQGSQCIGSERCHWCNSPCGRLWTHDDAPPIAFQRLQTTAKNYSGNWICKGCFFWRQTARTVFFRNGSLRDRVCPMNFSWWVDLDKAFALRPTEDEVYDLLLKPPTMFIFTLTDKTVNNCLHLSIVNQFEEVFADSKIRFTFNNIPHYYTVYELQEALNTSEQGKTPGVQLLIRLFGKPDKYKTPVVIESPTIVQTKGRPKKDFDKMVNQYKEGTPLTKKVS